MSESRPQSPAGIDPPTGLRRAADLTAHVESQLRADPATVAGALEALRECLLAGETYRLSIATFMGLTVNESLVMSYLVARGPMGVTDLRVVLDFTSGAMSLLVDRLEAKGMVERRPHPTDRRRSIVAVVERPDGDLSQASSWLSIVFADMDTAQVEQGRQALVTAALRLRHLAELVGATEDSAPAPRRRS